MKNIIDNKKIYFILLILIFLIFTAGVFAKYLLKTDDNFLYDANAFYFESDLLAENTNQKSYTYKRGIDYIEFTLKNNIDELRYSDVTITYNVILRDLNGNEVIDKSGNVIKNVTNTLKKGSINSEKVRFENLKTGTYVVTAIATKPYKKQIQANFILTNEDDSIIYQINDAVDSPVLNLTVSTKDYSGNVKIVWPSGVTPDSTDVNFEAINTGYASGNQIVSFKANSEYIFRFFKEDSLSVYTDADFSVERSD